MNIDGGRLFHCIIVLGEKERRLELVKVCKGMKLSGWACLVVRCTGRKRSFVSTEINPRVILNSVVSLISVRRCSSGLQFKSYEAIS